MKAGLLTTAKSVRDIRPLLETAAYMNACTLPEAASRVAAADRNALSEIGHKVMQRVESLRS